MPHINTASLHTERRVTALFSITSTDMPPITAVATRPATRNGIIHLTVTA
jgi:hypothetical protein